jgi:hypothetical protein
MNRRSILTIAAGLILAACATGTAPPARVYSPEERRGVFGAPSAQIGATGEARYCQRTSNGQNHRPQALANIAAICRGEQNVAITGELQADVRHTAAMGIETSCPRGDGRVIYFKCLSPSPQPSGAAK